MGVDGLGEDADADWARFNLSGAEIAWRLAAGDREGAEGVDGLETAGEGVGEVLGAEVGGMVAACLAALAAAAWRETEEDEDASASGWDEGGGVVAAEVAARRSRRLSRIYWIVADQDGGQRGGVEGRTRQQLSNGSEL